MASKRTKARVVLQWLLPGYLVMQLTLVLAEQRWPFLRDPHYGYRAARLQHRLTAASDRPTSVVMLGSSRALNAFRARQLESELEKQQGRPLVLFNFGIPSAGPAQQLVVLQRLLENGVRPDFLFVEVLPPLLARSLWPSSFSQLPVQRLGWSELPMVRGLDLDHEDRRLAWCCQNVLWPAFAHRYAILSHLTPFLLPLDKRSDFSRGIDGCGWVEVPNMPLSTEARRQQTAKARQNFAAYWNDDRIGGPNCVALALLLQRCQAEGIAVKLILMPEGPTFRSWYRPEGWKAVEKFLAELHQEFGVEVINTREWIEEEYFFDSHHLLPDGATRFSERLGREVLVPWLSCGR